MDIAAGGKPPGDDNGPPKKKVVLSNYKAFEQKTNMSEFHVTVRSFTNQLAGHLANLRRIGTDNEVSVNYDGTDTFTYLCLSLEERDKVLPQLYPLDPLLSLKYNKNHKKKVVRFARFIVKYVRGKNAIILSLDANLTAGLAATPSFSIGGQSLVILKYPQVEYCESCHYPVRTHSPDVACVPRCIKFGAQNHLDCGVVKCVRCIRSNEFRTYSRHLVTDVLCNVTDVLYNVTLKHLRNSPNQLYDLA